MAPVGESWKMKQSRKGADELDPKRIAMARASGFG